MNELADLFAISPSMRFGLTVSNQDSTLAVVDLKKHHVLHEMRVCFAPSAVAVNPNSSEIWITCDDTSPQHHGHVWVISAKTYKVIKKITVGFQPQLSNGIVFVPRLQRAYIANFGAGSGFQGGLTIISTRSHKVIKSIYLHSGVGDEDYGTVNDLSLSSSQRWLFLASDSAVYVVSTATDQLVRKIPVGSSAIASLLGRCPDGKTMEVASSVLSGDGLYDQISFISTGELKITSQLTLGNRQASGISCTSNNELSFVIEAGSKLLVLDGNHKLKTSLKGRFSSSGSPNAEVLPLEGTRRLFIPDDAGYIYELSA